MIVERMTGGRLREALAIAGAVVLVVILVRLALVLGWTRLVARFDALRAALPRPSVGRGVFVAWCGMRGLVTVATAFAPLIRIPLS